jgi:hypothetical protein
MHPSVAGHVISSDGSLSRASKQALYIGETALVLLGLTGLFIWRRWRVCTRARELAVLGLTFCFASIVVCGLAAEVGLTVVHRFVKPLGAERHYFFEHDPLLGWRHRPESAATFKKSLVRIDADGLRARSDDRRTAHTRMLLLGDSQAFGDGVSAEDTFASILENRTPGLRVLNASVIGYGTDQQLLYFERRGTAFAPDVTVVALNAYDVQDNLSTHVRSGYAKPRFVMTPDGLTLTNVPVPGDALADRLQRQLYRSHLIRLLGRTWRDTGRQREDGDLPRGRLELDVYPREPQFERGLQVTAAILNRLAQDARRAGSRFVVVFLPYLMDFGDVNGSYTQQTDRLVDVLSRQAAAGGFTFIDGRAGFAAARPDSLFLDTMHFTPEGHRRIAAVLQGALADGNLISRSYEH